MDAHDLLLETLRLGASDLHLVVGTPPAVRVHGAIQLLDEHPVLDAVACDTLVRSLLNPGQNAILDRDWQLSISISPTHPTTDEPLGHFRVSVHMRDGVAEAAIRVTPSRARTLEELGLPTILREFVGRDTGLVLITGPTGQGKTTTFNALIDIINRRSKKKIITIEDPVEFHHPHEQSLVIQLEVGTDTRSFADALRHALREDPDVICVGEMRDLETIATALTAAETGHLVIATLHTPSAIGTISRIIDVFPAAQQPQVRMQIVAALTAVVSQRLLPRADGLGRIVACEVLVSNDAVRNTIREDKLHMTQNILATSRNQGMMRLEDHLRKLLEAGLITRQAASAAANDVRAIQDLL